MPDYNGVTWRVNYGEIAEREQFRVGYVGSQSFDGYFEVAQLSDLITVLQGIPGASLGQLVRGSTVQARKTSSGLTTLVVIEPRSDTFPPQIMSLNSDTLSDLVYALQLFQTAISTAPIPDDWDGSYRAPVLYLNKKGEVQPPGMISGASRVVEQNVSGSVAITVQPDDMLVLTGTAAATVTLSGPTSCQVVVRWAGTTGTVNGTTMSAGSEVVFAKWPDGWKSYALGGSGDTTAPTPGVLSSSAITSSGFTLTISGASDAGGLHAQPYAFSTDNGVTWSAYQASASLAITGKTALTGYPCKGRVRDAAGNTADTPAQTVTTTSAGATWQTVAKDSFNGTDGTALTAHTSETGGVTYTGSQAGPKILSNKVDIYPYGGDQNAVSSSTTGLGSKFRASLGYVIPSTHGDYLRLVSLTVRDGVSAANGAGQFHAKVGIDLPSANSANGGLSGTSTYDGALTLTPVGGQNLNLVPLSGTLGISVDAGVLSVLINGTVWATVTAPAGCSFGSSVIWAMEPAGLYNGPHWQADDYLVEKYA